MWARFFSARPSAAVTSSAKAPLGLKGWIRQTHRWLAIVFTATVIANFGAMALGKPPAWVVYSPLPPLFLLLFTGLYMFALPYLAAPVPARTEPRAHSPR
jgi:cellulose synthase/poly-beta-1,6-N-acetylglucosamine synthase-like glycosyltransferase